jgi:hypothetical protein
MEGGRRTNNFGLLGQTTTAFGLRLHQGIKVREVLVGECFITA